MTTHVTTRLLVNYCAADYSTVPVPRTRIVIDTSSLFADALDFIFVSNDVPISVPPSPSVANDEDFVAPDVANDGGGIGSISTPASAPTPKLSPDGAFSTRLGALSAVNSAATSSDGAAVGGRMTVAT